MNDDHRRIWILNDEGLYNWYRGSNLTMREFIRQNRVDLDKVINNVTEGRKPAHYLTYGG